MQCILQQKTYTRNGYAHTVLLVFLILDPETEYLKFFLGNMATGGASGATNLLFIYPLDFARVRLAADIGKKADRQFSGVFDCLK